MGGSRSSEASCSSVDQAVQDPTSDPADSGAVRLAILLGDEAS